VLPGNNLYSTKKENSTIFLQLACHLQDYSILSIEIRGMNKASFHFHGNLTDFIKLPGKVSLIDYSFAGNPSIKDAIEAIGIPHPEIKLVIVNGHNKSISETLYNGSYIEVFPFIEVPDSPGKFILDVHLGKLARLMRLLGFDALYANHYSDKDIVDFIKIEQRIVLTRDVGLLKHKAIAWGYWLRSQVSFQQLVEVSARFQLKRSINPFSRCLVCNCQLHKIDKANVQHLLPLRTQLFFHEFYQCQDCRKVYWKGSHYEHMLQQIQNLP
jgi:uncharacterized protein